MNDRKHISNDRRLLALAALLVIGFLVCEALVHRYLGYRVLDGPLPSLFFTSLSISYFSFVVVNIVAASRGESSEQLNKLLLMVEVALSIALCVLAFSIAYRHFGISSDETCRNMYSPLDYIYFSAVTFSTLGHGDFRPCDAGQLLAAFHAIFGNLHLGLMIGAVLLFEGKSLLPAEGGNCREKASGGKYSESDEEPARNPIVGVDGHADPPLLNPDIGANSPKINVTDLLRRTSINRIRNRKIVKKSVKKR